jgi:hypothetical protein
MNKYTPFKPKHNISASKLTKAQAEEAYDFFIETKEKRLAELQSLLESTDSGVVLDFSISGLESLHDFFYGYTKVDHENKRDDLSLEAISLCNDVGIYISECVIKHASGIHWIMNTTKGDVYYQRPVIQGFNVKAKNFSYDFKHMLVGYAYDILETGDQDDEAFLNYFEGAMQYV